MAADKSRSLPDLFDRIFDAEKTATAKASGPTSTAVRSITGYRVRAIMIKPHTMIPSIPLARKFVAEKKVHILFFIPVWREVEDFILWYNTAKEAWEAIRRDAKPLNDDGGHPPEYAAKHVSFRVL